MTFALTDFEPPSMEESLQEYFGAVIPKLLEALKNRQTTHVLLLEKKARLLERPLRLLMEQEGLDIKIGSFAPDYFSDFDNYTKRDGFGSKEKEEIKNQKKRKLSFLPDSNNQDARILVLDEYHQTGKTVLKAVYGLQDMGFSNEQISWLALDGEKPAVGVLQADGTLEKAFFWQSDSRGRLNPFMIDHIFEDDTKFLRHARLNKRTPSSYKDAVQKLTKMILDAAK